MPKKSNQVLRDTLAVFLGGAVSALLGYGFTIVLVRGLGPEKFGVISTLISIILLFSVPYAMVSIILFYYLSFFKAKSQPEKISRLIREAFVNSIFIAIVLFILLSVLSPAIMYLLKINSDLGKYWLVLTAGILSLTIISTTIYGILNALQKFVTMSVMRILEGFAAYLAVLAILSKGEGVMMALLAKTLGIAILIPVGWRLLGKFRNLQGESLGDVGLRRYIIRAGSTIIILAALTNLGMILARFFLSALEAGYYAGILIFGNIPIAIGFAIAAVIFPKTAEAASDGADTSKILRDALLYLAISGAITLLVFAFFSSDVVVKFIGPGYPIENYLLPYGISALAFGFCLILSFYGIALKKWRVSIPLLLGLLVEISSVGLFHSTIMQVVLSILAAALITLAGIVLVLYREVIAALRQKKGYFKYEDIVNLPYRI